MIERIGTIFTLLSRALLSGFTGYGASPKMEAVMYHFSIEALQELKAQAIKHAASAGVEWLSTNDILSALLWSTTTYTRNDIGSQKHPDANCTMGMSVNLRGRLEPSLPSDYLGNAITVCWATVPKKTLLSAAVAASMQSLTEIAISIRRSLSKVDNNNIGNIIAYLGGQKDLTKLTWGVPTTNFMITSWANQDTYGLDWGEAIGKCEAIQSLARRDCCVILPQRPPKGGQPRGIIIIIIFIYVRGTSRRVWGRAKLRI
jgi:hypothetical protein